MKKICGQIPFFTISKMSKNQFLNWGKFKTAKNAISQKKMREVDLFDLTSFFA